MSVECGRRGCPGAPGWFCPKCMPWRYPEQLPDLRVIYPPKRNEA